MCGTVPGSVRSRAHATPRESRTGFVGTFQTPSIQCIRGLTLHFMVSRGHKRTKKYVSTVSYGRSSKKCDFWLFQLSLFSEKEPINLPLSKDVIVAIVSQVPCAQWEYSSIWFIVFLFEIFYRLNKIMNSVFFSFWSSANLRKLVLREHFQKHFQQSRIDCFKDRHKFMLMDKKDNLLN